MEIDYAVFNLLHGFAGRLLSLDQLIVFCAVYLPIAIAIVGLLYIYFSHKDRAAKIKTMVEILISIIIARGIFTTLIRILVNRGRPYSTEEAVSLFTTTGTSFPSAHASVLFAAGTTLYFFNKKAGVAFYAFSAIVCTARVIAGVHYPSDILAGALVGIASAALVHAYADRLYTAKLRQFLA